MRAIPERSGIPERESLERSGTPERESSVSTPPMRPLLPRAAAYVLPILLDRLHHRVEQVGGDLQTAQLRVDAFDELAPRRLELGRHGVDDEAALLHRLDGLVVLGLVVRRDLLAGL